MGTSYTFDGNISIDPPLNFREIQKAREVAMKMLRDGLGKRYATPENVFEGNMPLKLDITSFEEDTDRGPLSVTESARLIPSHPGEGSLSYGMAALVEALQEALPGHEWYGEVTALQEGREHAYKLVVTPSSVQEVKGYGQIEWGDGTKPTPITDLL